MIYDFNWFLALEMIKINEKGPFFIFFQRIYSSRADSDTIILFLS